MSDPGQQWTYLSKHGLDSENLTVLETVLRFSQIESRSLSLPKQANRLTRIDAYSQRAFSKTLLAKPTTRQHSGNMGRCK